MTDLEEIPMREPPDESPAATPAAVTPEQMARVIVPELFYAPAAPPAPARERDAASAAVVERLRALLLDACPDNTAKAVGTPDPDLGTFVCMNENGDPIVDTDDPVEAVEQIVRAWRRLGEQYERLRSEFVVSGEDVARLASELAAARADADKWRLSAASLLDDDSALGPIARAHNVVDAAAQYGVREKYTALLHDCSRVRGWLRSVDTILSARIDAARRAAPGEERDR